MKCKNCNSNKHLFCGNVKDFVKTAKSKINIFQQLEYNKEIGNIAFNLIKNKESV